MAKTANVNSSAPVSEDETQKKRKKQARREAKAMLAVEDAKAAVQRAEKKLGKAQARLEARNARLRALEANLTELRASLEEAEVSAPDIGFDHQAGQPELEEEKASPGQEHASTGEGAATPPAEDHADIPSTSPETDAWPPDENYQE